MPQQRLLLAEEWRSYAEVCVPSDAGIDQRQETRKAFYAGSVAVFSLMRKAIATTDDEATFAIFQSLEFEIGKFCVESRREAAEYEARTKASSQ